MPLTEKFKRGQHVWYYCSGYTVPKEYIYVSLMYNHTWTGRCRLVLVEGSRDCCTRNKDFLHATEHEALCAKVRWFKEHVRELQEIIEEAKTKKLKANLELFEVTKKLADDPVFNHGWHSGKRLSS